MRNLYDNAFDADGVLRDQRALRVRMVMMDGRSVAVDCGLGGPHRPGFRYSPEAQAVRDKAYDTMVKTAENAWKTAAQAAADTERFAEPPLCEDAREDAYLRYKDRLANAWRGAR